MIGSLSDASRTTARQPHDENHYANPKTGLGKKCYARQTPSITTLSIDVLY